MERKKKTDFGQFSQCFLIKSLVLKLLMVILEEVVLFNFRELYCFWRSGSFSSPTIRGKENLIEGISLSFKLIFFLISFFYFDFVFKFGKVLKIM